MAFAPQEVDPVLQRGSSLDWGQYVRPGGLSQQDIRSIDPLRGDPPEAVIEFLRTEPEPAAEFVAAFLKVLENITDDHFMEFIVSFLEQMLLNDPVVTTKMFVAEDGTLQVAPLMRLVRTSRSVTVVSKAGACIGLMAARRGRCQSLDPLVVWLIDSLASDPTGSDSWLAQRQLVALEMIPTALRCEEARAAFVAHHGLDSLQPFLGSDMPQQIYMACVGFWSTSMLSSAARQIVDNGLVAELIPLTKPDTMPEKVVRMALGCLANLGRDATCGEDAIASMGETSAVAENAQEVLDNDKITDPELKADAEFLVEAMASNTRVLTPLDRYVRELRSCKLHWSASHHAAFFSANALAFERERLALLKRLFDIIDNAAIEQGLRPPATAEEAGVADEVAAAGAAAARDAQAGTVHTAGGPFADSPIDRSSIDVTSTAIAINDIGQFAVAHPQGKVICARHGARQRVMRMLNHPAEEVKRQALLATSMMMIEKWQFVARGDGAE